MTTMAAIDSIECNTNVMKESSARPCIFKGLIVQKKSWHRHVRTHTFQSGNLMKNLPLSSISNIQPLIRNVEPPFASFERESSKNLKNKTKQNTCHVTLFFNSFQNTSSGAMFERFYYWPSIRTCKWRIDHSEKQHCYRYTR